MPHMPAPPYLKVRCYSETMEMKVKKSSIIILSVITVFNVYIIIEAFMNGYVSHRGSVSTITNEASMFWFDIFFRVSVNAIFWVVLFKYGDDKY